MTKRKIVQLAGCATLAMIVTGCAGINASKSVSPLDFLIPGGFIPGLLYNEPPNPLPVPMTAPGTLSSPESVALIS